MISTGSKFEFSRIQEFFFLCDKIEVLIATKYKRKIKE